MRKFYKDFFRNERGATSVEYALIIVVIGIGIIVSLQSIATGLDKIFTGLAGYVESSAD